MAFINIINNYSSVIIAFMIIETIILCFLIIESIFRYLAFRELKKIIKEVSQ